MSQKSVTREEVSELILRGSRFAVTCHRRPDGDALGSALGLASILRALGKEAVVFHPDPIPLSLKFLVADRPLAAPPEEPERFDATFVTDTAAAALLPEPFPPKSVTGPIVILDHHFTATEVGDLVLRDTQACATGAVVWSLIGPLGLKAVPKDAATPLYTSVVADTGGFRYPNTDAAALRMGAELLDAGADPWEVAYNLFEGWPPERVGLIRDVLGTLKRSDDGRLSILRVTRDVMDASGATDELVDGLVDYGRRIRGVEIAVLLWELPSRDGKPVAKVSLRSHGAMDVSAIAKEFGGGGHRVAAAAEVIMTLDELEAQVSPLAEKHLADHFGGASS